MTTPVSVGEWKEFFGSSVSLIGELEVLLPIRIGPLQSVSSGVDKGTPEVETDNRSVRNDDNAPAGFSNGRITSGDDRADSLPEVDFRHDASAPLTTIITGGCIEKEMSSVASVTPPLLDVMDDRKRPLSVASTSSSTSSLPRRYRKKFAGNVVACESTAETIDNALHPVVNVTSLPTVVECSLPEMLHKSASNRFEIGPHMLSSTVFNETPVTSLEACDVIDGAPPLVVRRVVEEIIETERAYVRDLEDVTCGYIGTIRSWSDELGLTDNDISVLFGNIEEIYSFNKKFLSMLDLCAYDPVKVARCFVDEAAGFVIYSDYCANYPHAILKLTECFNDEVIANALRHEQEALQHDLPLGSYLLKPVQRILKYQLLLQKMSQNMPSVCGDPHHCGDVGGTAGRSGTPRGSGADQGVMLAAVRCMIGVATRANEMRAEHANFDETRLDSDMSGSDSVVDFDSYGHVLLQDKFRLSGERVSRHVILFQRAIVIAKKRRTDGTLMAKALIESANLMLNESITKEPLSFQVIQFDSPRVQYTLQARNADQKRLWCQRIKKMILDNYSVVIPDKAKELVMTLGGKKSQVTESSHQHNHNVVPQYIDRWRNRRKSLGPLLDSKTKIKKGVLSNVVPVPLACSGPLSPLSSPQPRRKSDVTDLLLGAYKLVSSKSKSYNTGGSEIPTGDLTFLSHESRAGHHHTISCQPLQLEQHCDVIMTSYKSPTDEKSAHPGVQDEDLPALRRSPPPTGSSSTSAVVQDNDEIIRRRPFSRRSIPDILVEPPKQSHTTDVVVMSFQYSSEADEDTCNENHREDARCELVESMLSSVTQSSIDTYRRDSVALTKEKRASLPSNGLSRVGAGRVRREGSPAATGDQKLQVYEFDFALKPPRVEEKTRDCQLDGDCSTSSFSQRQRPGGKENEQTVAAGMDNGRGQSREPADDVDGKSSNKLREKTPCGSEDFASNSIDKQVVGDDKSNPWLLQPLGQTSRPATRLQRSCLVVKRSSPPPFAADDLRRSVASATPVKSTHCHAKHQLKADDTERRSVSCISPISFVAGFDHLQQHGVNHDRQLPTVKVAERLSVSSSAVPRCAESGHCSHSVCEDHKQSAERIENRDQCSASNRESPEFSDLLDQFSFDLAQEIINELMKQSNADDQLPRPVPTTSSAAVSAIRNSNPQSGPNYTTDESTETVQCRCDFGEPSAFESCAGFVSSDNYNSTHDLLSATDNVEVSPVCQSCRLTPLNCDQAMVDCQIDPLNGQTTSKDELPSPDRIFDAFKNLFAHFISKLGGHDHAKNADNDRGQDVVSVLPPSGAGSSISRQQLNNAVMTSSQTKADNGEHLIQKRSKIIGERMATPDPLVPYGETSALERALTIMHRRRYTAGDVAETVQTTSQIAKLLASVTSIPRSNVRRSSTVFCRKNLVEHSSLGCLQFRSSPASRCSMSPNSHEEMVATKLLDFDSEGSTWSLATSSSSSSALSRSSFYENKLTESLEHSEQRWQRRHRQPLGSGDRSPDDDDSGVVSKEGHVVLPWSRQWSLDDEVLE